MIPVTIACKRGPRQVDATYRNGVWSVTPWVGSRGRLAKSRFVVTHRPSGCVCKSGLDPMSHEAAVLLCRALGREFPGFYSEGTTARMDREGDGFHPPGATPDMGRRIRELYDEAVRAAQAVQSKVRTLSKK